MRQDFIVPPGKGHLEFVITVDEEKIFAYIDTDEFIERYVDEFRAGADDDVVSTCDFDKMLLAEGSAGETPDEVVWGAAQGFSKHIALVSEIPAESQSVDEIQTFLRKLNVGPSKQTINAFLAHLKQHFSSITTITAKHSSKSPTLPFQRRVTILWWT